MKCAVLLFGVWSFFLTGFEFLPLKNQPVLAASETAITFEEAVEKALVQHPEILAAQYHLESEDAKVRAARAAFYPHLYLNERFNYTDNPMYAFGTVLNQQSITREDFDPERLNNPDAVSNFNTSLGVSWEIFNAGRTRAGVNQAQKTYEIATVTLKQARQTIISRTSKAYVDLLLARENLEVAKQAVKTARVHSEMIQSRFRGGFVVKSDLLRAEVRSAEMEQAYLSAQSRAAVAQAALNAAMGNPNNPPLLPVSSFQDCAETSGPVEPWIEKAASSHPDLERLRLMETLIADEIEKAKAGHWPSLHLVGSYDIDTDDFSSTGESFALGALAHWSLFSGGRVQAQVLSAQAALKRVRELFNATRLTIGLKIRQAYSETQSAWQRIAVTKGALEQAEEGLRIVENRYRNGMLTLVSLLDAETARREARINHFKSLYDYHMARIDLVLAAGTIHVEWNTR